MNKKAFNIVESMLSEHLLKFNFNKKNLEDFSTVFFKDDKVYNLKYLSDKKQFKLLYANNDFNSLKDEDFKEISVWLFDPESDTEKEAKSIACDFVESLNFSVKKTNNKKSTGSDGQKTNDLMFFINRLATIFPELKDEIRREKESYSSFRGITFCKEKILPLILNLFKGSIQRDKIKKLCTAFNNFYDSGVLDVRASITIVFLNSIEDESSIEIIKGEISKDLNLAWKAALKYKGKNVKPEKIKKRANFFEMAQSRLDQQK